MKRLLLLVAALALVVGLSAPYAAARAEQPAAQDDAAKKEGMAAYKLWYDANQAKKYAEAVPLAKAYLEKYPSGQYAGYLTTWVNSLPILRIQLNEAVTRKDKAETIKLVKQILAVKDLAEQDRFEYLWFVTADLLQNELFASPQNFSHAAEVTEFSNQLLPLVKAGKKPAAVKDWNQAQVVAYLYTGLASIEDRNKNADKALENYKNALDAQPANAVASFACGKIHYERYGVAANKFSAFPDADRLAVEDNKPDAKPEVKAAFEEVNKAADATIDCWARYLGATMGQNNATRTQVQTAVETLYKYRHDDKLDGLQQLIDKYKGGGTPSPTPSSAGTNSGTAKPPAQTQQ
jgi:hypothetical protein